MKGDEVEADLGVLGELRRPPKLTLMMERLVYIVRVNPKARQVDIKEIIERRFNIELAQASISRYLRLLQNMKLKIGKLKAQNYL